ncbi:PREDICTED: agamous-like MADS-box protein AGL61 [Fragaria vesca subsp. vesca]|uniref:agamous-like MADS-box protein AGL61 n=1 Tax=Fragaria vesca subsp. vesca TaxID=101020 RepID=UPI0002C36381|nr:PREDICTED: agamous-like MADS-box protein AGL61 [Fragaria vesca subsp. vesca]
MGRRKIEIKKIQNKAYLKATFSKRRKGLFGKARELCDMCGAEIAILTVSPGGRFYNFGRPNVESVIARYCGDESSITVDENHDDCVISHEDDDEDLEGEQQRELEVSTDEVEDEDDIGSSHKAREEKEIINRIKEMNLIEHINRERDGRMRLQKFWWDEEKPIDPEQLEMYYHSLTQLRNNVVSVLNDRKMRELYAKDYLSMI